MKEQVNAKMEKNISANDFCRFIWKSYLEERRYDLISDFISDKISIIERVLMKLKEIYRNLLLR